MNSDNFNAAIAVVLVVILSLHRGAVYGSTETETGEGNRQFNVVVILVDDLGYSDIGVYNDQTFYETPNIDRLAVQGVQFLDGYAANPVCSPSRYALLTGKHPTPVGATDWFHVRGMPHRVEKFRPAESIEYLPQSETTLAEALKSLGYTTAFLGKWHLGEDEGHWPEHHGFDINIGGHETGHPAGGYFSPYENPRLSDGPEGEYLTDRLTSEAVRLLSRFAEAGSPFLLYLSFYTVHTPLQAPVATVERYRNKAGQNAETAEFAGEEQVWPTEEERLVRVRQSHATYAAMIDHLDQGVGRVLESIQTSGLEQNTIVVFTSDNGGLSTAEGSPTSNLPLRGGKGWLYEGGIRVPFIIKAPGSPQNGQAIRTPVVSMDLMPTILDYVGATPRETDGISLKPLLDGAREGGERPLFFHYPHYSNQGGFPGAAIRLGDWKMIERFEDGSVQLYHLGTDPGERADVSVTYPEVVGRLREMLHGWYEQTGARFLNPNPDRSEYGEPWRPGASD